MIPTRSISAYLAHRPRRGRALAAFAGLALLAARTRASAFDYDVDGFTRFTEHWNENLPLSPAGLPTQEEWVDMRISVTPRLHLGEDLVVAARVDALDGVIAGDGRDDLDVLAGLGDATGTRDRNGKQLDSIELDRGWIEYTPSFGLFRVGRQGSDWGLGILANSGGDKLEWGLAGNGPGTGDTVDRASFVTDLFQWLDIPRDHLLLGGAYDRVHEGDLLIRADDVSELVASVLYTNGTIRPRETGTREAGLYAIYVLNHDAHADLGVIDFYGRLELGPERYNLFGEIEGAWTVGSADRRGLVSDSLLDDAVTTATSAYTDALVKTGLDADSAATRAAQIAHHGSPAAGERAAITPDLVTDLESRGLSDDVALATADRIALSGVDTIASDTVTSQALGGVLRSGMRIGPLRAGVEIGGSRALASDDVTPPIVGPMGANKSQIASDAIRTELEARELEAALTGRRASLFSFDREYDPALILFDEVGPLGSDGSPTVANAFYVKLSGQMEILHGFDAFGLVVYGQLARKVERFRVECGPPADCRANLSAQVVPAGAADELGVEIDAGITYHLNDYLTAELRSGLLIPGQAFGPGAHDVFAIRPQIGVEW